MTLLHWETIESPIGRLAILATEAGIARIAWDCDDPARLAASELERVGASETKQGWNGPLKALKGQIEAWFVGDVAAFDLPLHPDPTVGTGFSARVLAATKAIPRGTTLTYAEIAAHAGNPKGARAAGNALGANPIPVVLPCHRVVAANGLGGFGGGSERKRILLAVEQA